MSFNTQHISFSETQQFSRLFTDYIAQDKKLENLYSSFFDKESITRYIQQNNFAYLNRQELVSELQKQNSFLLLSAETAKNIQLLASPDTFTITTGHQLCLFTGPLYFIYKILTVINCCEYLNKTIPGKQFVPVYWMASEDHDVEEISSANTFGKKLSWETKQTGKVGSFSTEGIEKVIAELEPILGDNTNSHHIISLLKKAYSARTLAEATRILVNELFGKYGLVSIDGDSRALKKLFSEEIKKELASEFSHEAVSSTNAILKEMGYSLQVNPRNINLFYAKNNIRERIEKQDKDYIVLNTDLKFTQEELNTLVEKEPELFSPNVITRPLYQQKILPNIAYVGGPGEIAYWLQLKQEFTSAGIHFPILVPRKFALIIDPSSQNKLQKNGLSLTQLFLETEQLIKEFIDADKDQLDLSGEKEALNTLFKVLKQKAEQVDKTLGGTVDGELQKTLKSLEHIEQKINRSLKAKNETAINQIRTIKQKLFPANSIQERYDNFIQYWLRNETFIDDIKEAFATQLGDLKHYLLLTEKADH